MISSRQLEIIFKVENWQVAKLAKSYYYFSRQIIFCLLKYHSDSSTIPVSFIVKFWYINIEMIFNTMKEESPYDYKDWISNWTPFS